MLMEDSRKTPRDKVHTRLGDWSSHRLSSLRIGGRDALGGLSSVGVVSKDIVVSAAAGFRSYREARRAAAVVVDSDAIKEAEKESLNFTDDTADEDTAPQ